MKIWRRKNNPFYSTRRVSHVYLIFSTGLINSIKQEHSCRILNLISDVE